MVTARLIRSWLVAKTARDGALAIPRSQPPFPSASPPSKPSPNEYPSTLRATNVRNLFRTNRSYASVPAATHCAYRVLDSGPSSLRTSQGLWRLEADDSASHCASVSCRHWGGLLACIRVVHPVSAVDAAHYTQSQGYSQSLGGRVPLLRIATLTAFFAAIASRGFSEYFSVYFGQLT